MKIYKVRITKKSFYSGHESQIQNPIKAANDIEAAKKAWDIATKLEIGLSGSLITKVEIQIPAGEMELRGQTVKTLPYWTEVNDGKAETGPNRCPNDHGPLTIIKKPCFVPPTEDMMDMLQSSGNFTEIPLPDKLKPKDYHAVFMTPTEEDRQIYTFIAAVCPECGYYVQYTMSQKQFTEAQKQK